MRKRSFPLFIVFMLCSLLLPPTLLTGQPAPVVQAADPQPILLKEDLGTVEMIEYKDMLFFEGVGFGADDGDLGSELWKSDGTAAGTVIVKDIHPGVYSSKPNRFTVVGDTLFFTAKSDRDGNSELWKSDGTAAGTVMVKDISSIRELINFNGMLIFLADDGIHGDELWKSDGTAAGTVMVKDILPGEGSAFPTHYNTTPEFTVMNDMLFFEVDDGIHGKELWKSDGTEDGTVIVKDMWPGADGSQPSYFTIMNSTLFFVAYGSGGLWKSDGTTAGTVLVKGDIAIATPQSGSVLFDNGPFTQINDTLFFVADDWLHGYELWKSDGTTAGTVIVKDISPGWYRSFGSNRTYFRTMNDMLFFMPEAKNNGDEEIDGERLWKSDGTAAGTMIVADIRPEDRGVSTWPPLTVVNETLFFLEYDNIHGTELWKSDGTDAGTMLVKDILPGSDSPFDEIHQSTFIEIGGLLFFETYNTMTDEYAFWQSDGTEAGTVIVMDQTRFPHTNAYINGTLFFGAKDNLYKLTIDPDATPDPTASSISGTVTDTIDDPLSGIEIMLARQDTSELVATTTTNASGEYSFDDIPSGILYTVAPNDPYFMYFPISHPIDTSSAQNHTDQDFARSVFTDFRPNPDGYSFANRTPEPLSQIADWESRKRQDMHEIFEEEVLYKDGLLRSEAHTWYFEKNQEVGGGMCFGFSATSLQFYWGQGYPLSTFQSDATTTYDLHWNNASRHLTRYSLWQYTKPIRTILYHSKYNETPNEILRQIGDHLLVGDPVILGVYSSSSEGGHAVAPYHIVHAGEGVYRVYVYDSNDPGETEHFVEFNVRADNDRGSWKYTNAPDIYNVWPFHYLGVPGIPRRTTWSGDGDSENIAVVPLSSLRKVGSDECDWCDDESVSLRSFGNIRLILTETQNQRMSRVGDTVASDIPNVQEFWPLGGLGLPVQPIYTMPISGNYTIQVNENDIESPHSASVTQFGPNYAVGVDNIQHPTGSQDELVISPDGNTIEYTADVSAEMSISFAMSSESDSSKYQIHGADVGTEQSIATSVNTETNRVVFSNAQSDGGTYDFEVNRINDTGLYTFTHALLDIGSGDTHYIDYSAWDGVGSMILDIDTGSDGTIDETVILENQANRMTVYLPLINR